MKVLVIVASGLPAGHVGCYGNEWLPTPALDRLAAEGIVFDCHYADHPSRAGADWAWRTGCYSLPQKNGAGNPSAPDVFALFSKSGVATRLITDRTLGPEQQAGWEKVRRLGPEAEESAVAQILLSAAEETLAELAAHKHWLCKIDLSFLRPPFEVPERFRSAFLAAEPTPLESAEDEDAELPVEGSNQESAEEGAILARTQELGMAVGYFDSCLADVYDQLESLELLDQLVLILTSDSGQPLEPTGLESPLALVREEGSHIPLLLRLPAEAETGQRVAALTQPIDLLPTLLETFGIPAPPMHGHSLWPLIRRERLSIRDYACSGIGRNASAAWCLRTPEWSFLRALLPAAEPMPPQLYVKPDDRWEVNDVRQHHLDLAEHLEQLLERFLEQARCPGLLVAPLLELSVEQSETIPAELPKTLPRKE
jgi:arylsulfatase A-like enzyme